MKNLKFLCSMLFLFGSICINAQSLDIPLVSVEGSAIIYQAPDEVHFHFQVDSAAPEIQSARNDNKAVVKEAVNFLRSKGVESKYIQTQHMSVGRNYKRNRNEFEGYLASQTVFVCLTDLRQYDEIADGLLQMKITRLNGPTFKNSNMDELKNQARQKAMLNAQAKAKLLAESLGQKIGKAKLISEVRYNTNRNSGAYSSGLDSSAGQDDDGLSFAPGQLEIRAFVNVSFKLLD